MSITLPLVARRYALLDEIGRGGMGVVYRALDRMTGQTVALKRVRTQQGLSAAFLSTGAGIDHRYLLAMEFQMLASLRHPHIISVLDYGFEADQQPFFTMELLENAQTILAACEGQPLDYQVALLTQMLQALLYLHRRKVLHRDLKPSNVLVVQGQVKLLDFGLSASTDDADNAHGALGTIAYLAPEILQGVPASIASDLYAAGVIAYQIFTGRHPFDTSTITSLIDQIETLVPDLAGLAPQLAVIVGRLLAKVAEDRYTSAADVIAALGDAISSPLPIETSATRESFLQAARFVGRQAELAALSDALSAALGGAGSVWLVGGESGVGKSRLLNEMRTLALVRGAYVLRGQADGGTPYQVWRSIVRWLVLAGDPAEDLTELEASVLKTIVPDIAALIERISVPDPPALDPGAAQTRLFVIVESLLRRQKRPLALILEDLHNAGTESLALLAWLVRAVTTLPLLIIGNYRDEEKSDLPKTVPGAKTLRLARLSRETIAELAETMLGAVGRWPDILDLLHRETEGNAFFLVEVVRALAEEAGELGKIGQMDVPKRVFAGGVQRIIERRLNLVAREDRPLLEVAAVAGRTLEPDILQAPGMPAPGMGGDFDGWLTRCANVAVLEIQDERWRFAHDKLRERLLADMAPQRRQQIHRLVAEALEKRPDDDPDRAAELYLHWAQAGETAKEQHYAALAGERALRIGANEEAITYFERALALEPPGEPMDSTARLRHSLWKRGISEAYSALGKLDRSLSYARDALRLLDYPEPPTRPAMLRSLLGQVVVQFWHRVRRLSGQEREDPQRAESARTYRELAEIYFFTADSLPGIHAVLRGLNLGEQVRPSPDLAQSYAGLVVVIGLLGRHTLAEAYSRRALAVAEALGDPLIVPHVKQRVGLYWVGIGDWARARTAFEEGIALYDGIGERLARARSMSALSFVLRQQGHLRQSAAMCDALYTDALRRGDVLLQTGGLASQASVALRLGRFDLLFKAAQTALNQLKEYPNLLVEARIHGILSAGYIRQGEAEKAREHAEKAAAALATISPTNYAAGDGYLRSAETLIALWELNLDSAGRAEYEAAARRACAAARRFARRFLYAAPGAAACEGETFWLAGQQDRAQRAWDQALRLSRALRMPYEEAMTLYHIGRHTGVRHHLGEAYAIFERIGAAHEMAEVAALLDTEIPI